MVSKTRLTECVKAFQWRDVKEALDEEPSFTRVRDNKGRNWLHVCSGTDVRAKASRKPQDSVKLAGS
jgi:hypothetical protein